MESDRNWSKNRRAAEAISYFDADRFGWDHANLVGQIEKIIEDCCVVYSGEFHKQKFEEYWAQERQSWENPEYIKGLRIVLDRFDENGVKK